MRSWRQLALEQLDEQDGEAEQSNGKINGSTFNKGDGVFRDSRGRTLTVCVYGVGGVCHSPVCFLDLHGAGARAGEREFRRLGFGSSLTLFGSA